jgi:hypothetical protein
LHPGNEVRAVLLYHTPPSRCAAFHRPKNGANCACTETSRTKPEQPSCLYALITSCMSYGDRKFPVKHPHFLPVCANSPGHRPDPPGPGSDPFHTLFSLCASIVQIGLRFCLPLLWVSPAQAGPGLLLCKCATQQQNGARGWAELCDIC